MKKKSHTINTRVKGKVGERYFAKLLREVFPDVQRNAGTQSREGGCDLINTSPFNFEIKYGSTYKSKKVRSWIDQVQREGLSSNWNIVLVKPDREKSYAVIPFEDLVEILLNMKTNDIF